MYLESRYTLRRLVGYELIRHDTHYLEEVYIHIVYTYKLCNRFGSSWLCAKVISIALVWYPALAGV
jgi:hypothetical protein